MHLISNTKLFLAVVGLGLLLGCAPHKQMARKISKVFRQEQPAPPYQIGFALYDPTSKQMIMQKDADKYFTPASNTKLFTFYAGLKIYPDSIPSLRYKIKGDSLFFWGLGDPSLLHSELKGTKALNFLAKSSQQLFFVPGHYKGDFFGNGWSWDDYNEYYQPEISELPLYDNVLALSAKADGSLNLSPKFFQTCLFADSSQRTPKSFRVQRDFLSNSFSYPLAKAPQGYAQQVPFKTSTALSLALLADTLHREIKIANIPFDYSSKILYSSKSEDVLRAMMLPSDNFIAEQLLLGYADKLGTSMEASAVIAAIKKQYLGALPDPPKWVDGSGLSRGNLFTPRSIIKLLELIFEEVNDKDKLLSLLPAGGKTGTLRNTYPKNSPPFVFAKTGTLGGVHNQSGYVLTKKGKFLLFSFMNNNYVQPTATVRKEMVKIMTYIHDTF